VSQEQGGDVRVMMQRCENGQNVVQQILTASLLLHDPSTRRAFLEG
jgi:hypothetical protein